MGGPLAAGGPGQLPPPLNPALISVVENDTVPYKID